MSCLRELKVFWLVPVLAVVLLALAPGPGCADDPDWIGPIKAAYRRLDTKLNNFSVVAHRYQREELVGKPPGKKKLEETFEVSRLGSSLKSARLQRENPELRSYAGINEDYFFLVRDNASGSGRSLVDLGERGQFALYNMFYHQAAFQIAEDAGPVMGTFGFPLELPIAALRHHHTLRAQQIEEEERKLLLLEGDFAPFIDTSGVPPQYLPSFAQHPSRIFLDPARDYRIVRWESRRMSGGKEYLQVRSYEYDHSADGYPVPSRFVFSSGTPTVGYSFMEVEFSDWRVNVNQPEEFRLPYFGLKEPDYRRKPFVSGWLRIVLIGAALVAVGAWLYRRSAARVS